MIIFGCTNFVFIRRYFALCINWQNQSVGDLSGYRYIAVQIQIYISVFTNPRMRNKKRENLRQMLQFNFFFSCLKPSVCQENFPNLSSCCQYDGPLCPRVTPDPSCLSNFKFWCSNTGLLLHSGLCPPHLPYTMDLVLFNALHSVPYTWDTFPFLIYLSYSHLTFVLPNLSTHHTRQSDLSLLASGCLSFLLAVSIVWAHSLKILFCYFICISFLGLDNQFLGGRV